MDFSGVTIVCVGDVMLDRFIYGDIERISPEAPVPVLRLRHTRTMLGGAGNVASNIASLGGRAIVVGLVGQDEAARSIGRHIEAAPGLTSALVETGLRPTVCKTRYLASQQQVVRADEESSLALQPAERLGLLAELERVLPRAHAVVLSDYGKGVLDDVVIAASVAACRARGIAVFVDPKGIDFSRYAGATCITPNLKELAAASGLPVDSEAQVVAAASALIARTGVGAVLATRSEKGMVLVEASGEHHSVPARTREVFDVSGAGDTVIATLALAHASGLSLVRAMRISNAAAGVVVSKVGTATVQPAELLHELDAEHDGGGQPTRSPMRSSLETAALVAHWKDQGLTVGFTNGCFDILHAGHIGLLAAARTHCDRLVLALNSDASIGRLKGVGRPVNPLAQRAVVMGAIKYVDCLVSFDEDTPLGLIETLLPDRLIKGADYTVQTVVGAAVVQANGGKVVLCDLVAGQSTTRIVEKIRA